MNKNHQNITETSLLDQSISQQSLVIVPGHGPEALLWIIVDAFLLVAIVTGNSLSIAIILRTKRRRNRNKKLKVKGQRQQSKSKCSGRKQPQEMGLHGSEHERKGPEEMARNCRRPPSRSSCFVLSLAISDLLVGLAMPFHMTFYIQGADREASIRQDEGITLGEIEWTCLLRFVLIALACSASACNLMAIAVDRYLAIVHPLHYNRYMVKRVAGAIIFSCWVSALIFATVPAYWNRWKSAQSCELDEIFTPQYITCVIPPLFSAVVVALTILYWRIGREARSQLSRFLGADGNGPPWRRYQSGKTYCSSVSSNENQSDNCRILNSQYIPAEDDNHCELGNQATTSEMTTKPDTTKRNSGGLTSTTTESKCMEYDGGDLDSYKNATNFHTLYKIEEESDYIENGELDSILQNAADPCKICSQPQYEQRTSHTELDGDKPLLRNRDESDLDPKTSDNSKKITKGISDYSSKNFVMNKIPTEIVSSQVEAKFKKPKMKETEITTITPENYLALSRCPNKSIAMSIANLKGYFHNSPPLGKNNNCSSRDAIAYDCYQKLWEMNNNLAFENKVSLMPDIPKIYNEENRKIITQTFQFNRGDQLNCQNTTVQDYKSTYGTLESAQEKTSVMTRNCSNLSKTSEELILTVNSLDFINNVAAKEKMFTDVGKEKENNCSEMTHSSPRNADKNELFETDLNPGSQIKSTNEITEMEKEVIRHYNDSKSLDNTSNVEVSNLGDDSRDDTDKERADDKERSSWQKDKNDHRQVLKTRSSSCTSQDDPRSNAWNIRFPSLTSAGTTVRPLSKSTIVVLLVLGSFVLLWLPYIVVCALLVNGCHLPYNIYRATFSLAMSNSGVNPIIYGWKNAELKRVFLRFILKKWHKCFSKYRKEEPTLQIAVEL